MCNEHGNLVGGRSAPGLASETVDEIVENRIRPIKNVPGIVAGRPLHRLAKVRKQQRMSLRTMSRRLGVDVATVIEQERETADPPLSAIYAWQRILDVPVADLLEESDARLSAPVFERARLVKLMKTAAAISEKAHSNSLRGLVTGLIEQLVEIMPELRDVTAWNTVGQRRTLDDYGRVVERQVPDDFSRRTTR
jgi:transcriptional regulator with XRE-family HTH domain